jgi:lipopolysaccharide biosynthesis glycosyltransferase
MSIRNTFRKIILGDQIWTRLTAPDDTENRAGFKNVRGPKRALRRILLGRNIWWRLGLSNEEIAALPQIVTDRNFVAQLLYKLRQIVLDESNFRVLYPKKHLFLSPVERRVQKRIDSVRREIKAGADVNKRRLEGALSKLEEVRKEVRSGNGINKRHLEEVRKEVKAGADINKRRLEDVRKEVKASADINKSRLESAVLKLEEVRKEVKSGADINKRHLKTIGKIRLAPALKKDTARNPDALSTPQYIVTLTSYGERLTKTAPYAIASLLAQMEQPDRLILWVAHADGPRIFNANADITAIYAELLAKGVEIRYCEDLKSYKKLVPALREFPDDILITADDDCLYPFDWFAKLKATAAENPGKIVCHRAHEILVDGEHYPLAYDSWRKSVSAEDFAQMPNSVIFPAGAGGILYPPRSLDTRVLYAARTSNPQGKDMDKMLSALRILPAADNIWFWAMAKLAGTEYAVAPDGYRKDAVIDETISKQRRANGIRYDEQLAAMLKEFPELKESVFDNIEPAKRVYSMYYAPEWRAREIADNWDGKIELPIIKKDNYLPPQTTILIVLATNDDFAPFCAVTVQSILEHSNPQREYRIYIFQRELSQETKAKISAQVALYPHCRIIFLDVAALFDKIPIRIRISVNALSLDAYCRLLIPYIFAEYEKVIYCDSDMLVMTDIAELYDVNLQDKPLGACVDEHPRNIEKYAPENIEIFTQNLSCAKLGLFEYNQNYLYFNSGLLLFNTTKFSKTVSMDKLLRLAIYYTHRLESRLNDQDILNIKFNKNYVSLSSLWNFFWYIGDKSKYFNVTDYYEYVEKNWKEAKILHLANSRKPWNYLFFSPISEYYREYASKVPLYVERAPDTELKKYLKNCLTPQKAWEMGYRSIFGTSSSFGDGVLCLSAIKQYHIITGNKPLIMADNSYQLLYSGMADSTYQSQYLGSDFCYVLLGCFGGPVTRDNYAKIYENGGNITVYDNNESFTFEVIHPQWWRIEYGRFVNDKFYLGFVRKHILRLYCENIGIEGKIEIKPHLELTDDDKRFGRLSPIEKKQIVIMGEGIFKYKTLPYEIRQTIIDELHGEFFFIQIGIHSDRLLEGVLDLRGTLSLRQVASVLYNSDLFVGTIGGLMHLARAVECPAVIAYSAEPLELCYYAGNSYVFSETPCNICEEGKMDPHREVCMNDYCCIRNISVKKMVAAILEKLSTPREFPYQTDFCEKKIPEALEVSYLLSLDRRLPNAMVRR